MFSPSPLCICQLSLGFYLELFLLLALILKFILWFEGWGQLDLKHILPQSLSVAVSHTVTVSVTYL